MGKPLYTVNDTSVYVSRTCTGALCPPNAVPYVQNNQNNALAPAGSTFATCAGGVLAGCQTAVATPFPDISNDPDHMRCARLCSAGNTSRASALWLHSRCAGPALLRLALTALCVAWRV
jgi:hypothetical protein